MRPRVLAAALAAVAVLASCGSDRATDASATTTSASPTAAAPTVVTATKVRGGPAGTTVLSAEAAMHASVSVADAALPAGVAADAITATVAAAITPTSGAAMVFSLGPDGTKFTKPVRLEWDGPWSPNSVVSIAAFDGKGTPIDNGDSAAVNTARALQVETTSATTAHYGLPIDHFSTWVVAISTANSKVSATTTDATVAPDGATLDIMIAASVRGQPTAACVNADDRWLTVQPRGLAVAHYDEGSGCWSDSGRLRLKVACTTWGDGVIEGQLRAVLVTGDLRWLPPDAIDLIKDLASKLPPEFGALHDIGYGTSAGMFAFRQRIRCNDNLLVLDLDSVTDAAAATSAVPTSTAPSTSSTIADLLVVPTVPVPPIATEPAPRPTSATTPAPAGSSSSTSSSTTSTSTTSTSTSTTSTSSSTTSTSTSTSSTTTTVWDTGRWDHNEYGSCSWNDTGGCGIYLGDSPGVYRIGPLGDANTRFS